jgi:CDGSH-type Zn-finger protein
LGRRPLPVKVPAARRRATSEQVEERAMNDANEPLCPRTAPYPIEVEAGKKYFWCACGRSKKQPFCDGSHKDTGFSPVKYDATAAKTVFFCGCKHSGSKPLCDGTHSKLP